MINFSNAPKQQIVTFECNNSLRQPNKSHVFSILALWALQLEIWVRHTRKTFIISYIYIYIYIYLLYHYHLLFGSSLRSIG
jgi:hypothetical protein